MGIKAAAKSEYSNAIRSLFPRGEYWERQFADPKSDLNLFCDAKAQEIINLRKRMNALLTESKYETAIETIDEWERVLLGYMNVHLPLQVRRERLSFQKTPAVNYAVIKDTANRYGLTLTDIVFPLKPSFFGFSKFGRSMYSRPAFYSVFYIILAFQNDSFNNEMNLQTFERDINTKLVSGNIAYFIYK
jgi:hypothetical protein